MEPGKTRPAEARANLDYTLEYWRGTRAAP